MKTDKKRTNFPSPKNKDISGKALNRTRIGLRDLPLSYAPQTRDRDRQVWMKIALHCTKNSKLAFGYRRSGLLPPRSSVGQRTRVSFSEIPVKQTLKQNTQGHSIRKQWCSIKSKE